MNFTGKNLLLIRDAVDAAITNTQYTIGSCPDVFEFADDIVELERVKACYEALLARIERSIAKGQP